MQRRTVLLIVAAILLAALLVVFGLYNRGNPVILDFGLVRWRGEAVLALYGAIFLGLALMFLIGLPADLATRRELRRLRRRVDELEREEPAREPPAREPTA
ncbi:MAG: lipopolysaccharide assembly protein LapA domain-containing protein [Gemmatimonadota bacterium]|nr:lipopolysaccharide assembly protein LapA domain-containing protein [Gemmatimonadota bacterium]